MDYGQERPVGLRSFVSSVPLEDCSYGTKAIRMRRLLIHAWLLMQALVLAVGMASARLASSGILLYSLGFTGAYQLQHSH